MRKRVKHRPQNGGSFFCGIKLRFWDKNAHFPKLKESTTHLYVTWFNSVIHNLVVHNLLICIQPRYTQPGYRQPSYTQPGYRQPSYTQPGYTQPEHGDGNVDRPRKSVERIIN